MIHSSNLHDVSSQSCGSCCSQDRVKIKVKKMVFLWFLAQALGHFS